MASGARTPLLALRALTRPSNLAAIVVPAVALGAVALALAAFDRRDAEGALLVAMAPAPLLAPDVAGRMRGRSDLAGALVLGTVLLSLLVAATRGTLASGAGVFAVEAYAFAAMFANALPTARDLVLAPLRWLAVISALAVIAVGLLATPPDAAALAVALTVLVTGALTAAAVAVLFRRDVVATVGGAGLRDPVLAIALASTSGSSAAVPVAYAVVIVVVAAAALFRR